MFTLTPKEIASAIRETADKIDKGRDNGLYNSEREFIACEDTLAEVAHQLGNRISAELPDHFNWAAFLNDCGV